MQSSSGTNLWSSLLKESSKRSRFPDSSCVFVGDSDCGKSSLVEKLCSSEAHTKQDEVKKEIVSYNFFDVDDSVSDSSRVNVWSISEVTFPASWFLKPTKNDRVVFLIGVDMSKPDECVNSVKKWLLAVGTDAKRLMDGMDGDAAVDRKRRWAQYISFARTGNITWDDFGDSNGDYEGKMTIGCPIVVVGCKCDAIKANDLSSIKRMKEIQGQLRSICLQFSASLVFTSATENVNCSRLRKYMVHCLHPETIPQNDLGIEEGAEFCFVPAGFDTPQLISISTGLSESDQMAIGDDISKRLHDIWISASVSTSLESAPRPKPSSLHALPTPPPPSQIVDIEDEEEWLSGLQNFVKQVTEANPSLPSPPTSSAVSALASAPDASLSQNKDTGLRSSSTGTELGELDTKPSVPKPRRQTSVMKIGKAGAGEQKQDVNSFFQNLLSASSTPKKPTS